VLAEIARRRFASPFPAYVPDDEWRAFKSKSPVPRNRQTDIRRKRAAREEEIAGWLRGEYRQALASNPSLRESIRGQLEALETRLDVDLL
jgi:hypothetical protein